MHIKIMKVIVIFGAAILASYLFLTRPVQTNQVYAQKGDTNITFGRITTNHSLVTRLPVSRKTHIGQVNTVMITYGGTSTCQVDFYIYKNGEEVYHHVVEDASLMKDNDWFHLDNIDLYCTPEDEVYLVITSPDGTSDNSISAWLKKEGDGPQIYVYDWESGEATEYTGVPRLTIYESRWPLDDLYRSHPSLGWFAILILGILLGLIALLAIDLLPLKELRRKKHEADNPNSLL